MPYPTIDLLATEESGSLYAHLSFYRNRKDWLFGRPPFLLNDFIMQLRSKGHTRGDSGLWIPVRHDVVGQFWGNVKRYLGRAHRLGYFGDHRIGYGGWFCSFKHGWINQGTEKPRRYDYSDPYGVLSILTKAFSREEVLAA